MVIAKKEFAAMSEVNANNSDNNDSCQAQFMDLMNGLGQTKKRKYVETLASCLACSEEEEPIFNLH